MSTDGPPKNKIINKQTYLNEFSIRYFIILEVIRVQWGELVELSEVIEVN